MPEFDSAPLSSEEYFFIQYRFPHMPTEEWCRYGIRAEKMSFERAAAECKRAAEKWKDAQYGLVRSVTILETITL